MLATIVASLALTSLLRRLRPPTVGRETAIAVLGTLPALAALRDPRRSPPITAVEHKAIGGYEQGTDPAEVPKEHERCGSNLIAPMLLLSIAGQLLVERLLARPGPLARGVAAAAGVGGAVEMFAYASAIRIGRRPRRSRRPGTRSSACSRPGSRAPSSSRSGSSPWPRSSERRASSPRRPAAARQSSRLRARCSG